MPPADGGAAQACTIIAGNYLAYARVLAASFLRHHPGWEFTVVVIDGRPADAGPVEAFRVVHLEDLGLPVAERHRMATIYDVTELATAMKPFVLRFLLAEGRGPAVYLDPDIEVHHPFREVADLARQHGIVLTPHVLEPMPRDGFTPSETNILISGMFNLGFIAVGPQGGPFLDFWAERLRRDAVIDPGRGLFTDQRWVDFVPTLFDHHVIRSPAFNVAYWNVYARPLTREGDTYLAGGEPLRFYHFSGFDPSRPHILSRHHGHNPRTLLSASPVLAGLCRDYAAAVWAAGHRESAAAPYGLGSFPNGLRLDARSRRLYRAALESTGGTGPGEGGGTEPPDPFEPGGPERLLDWLRSPSDGGVVSRYLTAYWEERPDLRAAFPELSGSTAERYLRWAAHDPALAGEASAALRTTARPTSARHPTADRRPGHRFPARSPLPAPGPPGTPLAPGITVAGYFTAELGVGQAGRLLLAGIEATGVPFATVTYDRTPSSRAHPFRSSGGDGRFDVTVMCVNADQVPVFVRDMGPGFLDGTYRIGMWFWEVDILPASMHEAVDHVDEIWVASPFVRAAIERITTKPVHVVPLPALVPSRPTHATKADFDLPDRFVFLCSFDFFSVVGRKNPDDVIEAFTRAFRPGEAALIIKTINGSDEQPALNALKASAATHPDIRVVDAYLPADRMRALTGVADCMVSLHRSEGFGLGLLEAMAQGRPVIATGYSGNLAFMDDDNSFLVPYDLVPVGAGHDPYPATALWAQPHVDEAARLMRLVVDDRAAGVARGERGQRTLVERHTVARTSAFVTERLRRIRHARSPDLVGH